MSNSKIKAILFDNDGTIVDSEETILKSAKHTLQTGLGIKNPDLQEFRKLVGLPSIDQFLRYTDDRKKAEELVAIYRADNHSSVESQIKNYDGMIEVLEELKKQGFYLGIVTSKKRDVCVRGLKYLGLYDYFEYIQGSDDWPVHKPDPGALSHACEAIGCKPEEVLYVGDSSYDVDSGNGAGCKTCAVLWGFFEKEWLIPSNPDYFAEVPSDLLDIVKK